MKKNKSAAISSLLVKTAADCWGGRGERGEQWDTWRETDKDREADDMVDMMVCLLFVYMNYSTQ